MKDFLMFNAGECEDGLRNRDLYLVQGVANEDAARDKLAEFFTKQEYTDCAEDYACLVSGENLTADAGMPACRMYVVE